MDIAIQERIKAILKDAKDPGSVARFAQVALDQICTAIEAVDPPEKYPAIIPSYRLSLNKTAFSLKVAFGQELIGTIEDIVEAKFDERTNSKKSPTTVPFTGYSTKELPAEKAAETPDDPLLVSEMAKQSAAKKTPNKKNAS